MFGDFGGFGDDAWVENGNLNLPQRPGVGFEARARLYAIMEKLAG